MIVEKVRNHTRAGSRLRYLKKARWPYDEHYKIKE